MTNDTDATLERDTHTTIASSTRAVALVAVAVALVAVASTRRASTRDCRAASTRASRVRVWRRRRRRCPDDVFNCLCLNVDSPRVSRRRIARHRRDRAGHRAAHRARIAMKPRARATGARARAERRQGAQQSVGTGAFKRRGAKTVVTAPSARAPTASAAKKTTRITKTSAAKKTTTGAPPRARRVVKGTSKGVVKVKTATRARASGARKATAKPRKRVGGVVTAPIEEIIPELPVEVIEARTLRVNLSVMLNKTLANDYEESRGDEPRATTKVGVTVSDILKRFTDEQAGKIKSPKQLETMRAIVCGIEGAFNDAFYASLLYKDEWHIAKTPTPSKVFGVLHLLRLLAKFPEMVPPHAFASDDHAKAMNVKLNELGRYIDRNATALGVPLPSKPERKRKSSANLGTADA